MVDVDALADHGKKITSIEEGEQSVPVRVIEGIARRAGGESKSSLRAEKLVACRFVAFKMGLAISRLAGCTRGGAACEAGAEPPELEASTGQRFDLSCCVAYEESAASRDASVRRERDGDRAFDTCHNPTVRESALQEAVEKRSRRDAAAHGQAHPEASCLCRDRPSEEAGCNVPPDEDIDSISFGRRLYLGLRRAQAEGEGAKAAP